jgi:hypothetical protein
MAEARVERRLAAILAADVAGFSHLTWPRCPLPVMQPAPKSAFKELQPELTPGRLRLS